MRRTMRALGLLLLPAVAAAQFTIRARVVEEGTDRPLAGALVSAVGGPLPGAAVLAGADGMATVRVGATGVYRLLVRRIGYAPFTSDTVRVAGTSSVVVTLTVPSARIALSVVRVTAHRACDAGAPSTTSESGQIWEEVRKALESSVISRGSSFVVTTGFAFHRTLDENGKLLQEDTTSRGTSGARPFTSVDAASLERNGYVTGTFRSQMTFNAPDEQVLLSSSFLRMHCLSMASQVRRSGDTTLVGLAFEPRTNNQLPEIQGTLWVDSASSELRRLEYSYVRAPVPFAVGSLGGFVDFRRHQNGAFYVTGWTIRMPRWRLSNLNVSGVALAGFEEVGGSANVVRERSVVNASRVRSVTGSVFDSLAMRDLTGAVVRIPGLNRETTTDFLGRFRFDSVAIGVWDVTVDYTPLAGSDLVRLTGSADVVESERSDLVLAVPSLGRLWKKACPGQPMPKGSGGFVSGLVRNPSRQPVGGAAVEFAWKDDAPDSNRSVTVRSGPDGRYFACVGSGAGVTTRALRDSISSAQVTFSFVPARVVTRDVVVGTDEEVEAAAADSGSVVESAPPTSGSVVTGIVRDPTGRAVSNARVRLLGVAGDVRTSGAGRFTWRGVPAGQRVVSIEAIGFERARRVVFLAGQDSAYLDVRVGRRTTLRTVNVTERERMTSVRRDIEDRVLAAHGFIFDSTRVARAAGYRSLFDVTGARVRTMGTSFTVELPRASFSGKDAGVRWCAPALFIDDQISDTDKLNGYPQENIALIEFYSRIAGAPLKYTGTGSGATTGARDGDCGAILVWTKNFMRATDMMMKANAAPPKKP